VSVIYTDSCTHTTNAGINFPVEIWTDYRCRHFTEEKIHVADKYLKKSPTPTPLLIRLSENKTKPNKKWSIDRLQTA
jgi:hypothetical protein